MKWLIGISLAPPAPQDYCSSLDQDSIVKPRGSSTTYAGDPNWSNDLEPNEGPQFYGFLRRTGTSSYLEGYLGLRSIAAVFSLIFTSIILDSLQSSDPKRGSEFSVNCVSSTVTPLVCLLIFSPRLVPKLIRSKNHDCGYCRSRVRFSKPSFETKNERVFLKRRF